MFTHHNRHQHFFKNKEVDELYIAVFLMNLADNLISVFVPIFLYGLGYSLVKIIFFYFLGNLFSVLFAVPVAKIVGKIGPKYAILLSALPCIFYYYGFNYLAGNSFLFFFLAFLASIGALFYNFGFDLNFITHGDRKKIGSELSIMGALTVLTSVISPLVAGIIVVTFGYNLLFAVGSALLFVSAWPLFFSGNEYRQIKTNLQSVVSCMKSEPARGARISFMGYAIESSIGRIIWPIFLFAILKFVEEVGLVVSISALFTVAFLAVIGRFVDKYDNKKLLKFGTMLYFLSWVSTVFASNVTRVLFVETYKKMAERFILLPWSASFYLSIRKKTYFESVVARDMIFNISRVLLLPILMLIFYFNVAPFTISFLIAASFTLLYPFLPPLPETKIA